MKLRAQATILSATSMMVVLVACGGAGGSSQKRVASRGFKASEGVNFSKCMRAHGLADFPDVTPNQGLPIQHRLDGSVAILINGVAQPVSAPKLNRALHSCARYMISFAEPVGAGVTPGTIQHALVRTAECMRKNGVPRYPDPSPLGSNGEFHMSPTAQARDAGLNIDSPAFKTAISRCGSIMSRAMGRG